MPEEQEKKKKKKKKSKKASEFGLKTGEPTSLTHVIPILHVRIPIDPNDAASKDDKFKLTSTDGQYEKILTVKDDKVDGDAFVDLVFDNLKVNLNYTLEINPGKEGKPYNVFEDEPLEDVIDYYSMLEEGDSLEEDDEEEENSKEAPKQDWENEGGGGMQYGGDPDTTDNAMEQIMESEEPDEGEEINWNTFDPKKVKVENDAGGDEEIDEFAKW